MSINYVGLPGEPHKTWAMLGTKSAKISLPGTQAEMACVNSSPVDAPAPNPPVQAHLFSRSPISLLVRNLTLRCKGLLIRQATRKPPLKP